MMQQQKISAENSQKELDRIKAQDAIDQQSKEAKRERKALKKEMRKLDAY